MVQGIQENDQDGKIKVSAYNTLIHRGRQYTRRILPVIFDAHESQNKHSKLTPHDSLYLKEALTVPIESINLLSVNPGEPYFLVWYYLSSYLPLTCACLAPLANMISLIAFLVHWRRNIETNKLVADERGLIILNSISLAFGIIGNVALLMNFSKSIRYLVAQTVSIICWISASGHLLVVVIKTSKFFTGESAQYKPSEGFWFGVFTTFFYFTCSIILIINFVGYRLEKYPPTFNLDYKQRTLMLYTICFSVWMSFGAVLTFHLIPNLNYGSSLYFCTVSVLTVGLGDILPISTRAKMFVLVFSFIGIIITLLIITMIRQVMLATSGPTVFWHLIEKLRQKEFNRINDDTIQSIEKESFNKIQSIRKKAKRFQRILSFLLSLLSFIILWFGGATVFFFCEHWSYVDSFYFCFLSLITIGYGDYAPKTPLGRVFFVSWGITAVPIMTIIVSNLGDGLYEFADETGHFITKWFDSEYYSYLKTKEESDIVEASNYNQERTELDIEEMANANLLKFIQSSNTVESVVNIKITAFEKLVNDVTDASSKLASPNYTKEINERLLAFVEEQQKLITSAQLSVDQLKRLVVDSLQDPMKSYDHLEWSEIFKRNKDLQNLGLEASTMNQSSQIPQHFWIGEHSPLRLPLKESHYLMMNIFKVLEGDLHNFKAYLSNLEQALNGISKSDSN